MSSVTSTWPSQLGEAPMPMVGQATRPVISAANLLHHAFEHEQERARLVDRAGVGDDLPRLRLVAAAGAVAAQSVDRLRGQPDMADHRYSARLRKATVSAIASPPSSLTAAAPVSLRIRDALANACCGLAS